jgi:threonine synthase
MDGLGPIAIEIVRSLGRPPAAVYVPCGGGGLISSLGIAFGRLLADGEIDHLPGMIGVQAAGCAPIHNSMVSGSRTLQPVARSESAIAAVSLGNPPDGQLALDTIRASGGFSVAVTDDEAHAAVDSLARRYGLLVEPAGALSYAAYLKQAIPDSVAILTGSGLKSLTSSGPPAPPEKTTIEALASGV